MLSKGGNTMRKWSIGFSVIFFAVFFAGSLFAQEPRFSIPLPLTGTNAKFGEIEKNSYEIAMEEINAAGGIKGK
jgi:branched-chain amino acid transport system substrate-binding protein